MQKYYCKILVSPLRTEDSDTAEMSSQMLYGETCEILDTKGDFSKIKMDFDGYEGWIDTKSLAEVEDEKPKQIISQTFGVFDLKEGRSLLSIGSEVDFEVENKVDVSDIRNSIVNTAKQFLNVPFLWGGRSFFGIDSAGFAQLVYKVHGIKIPRDAHQQQELGEVRHFVEESEPGDLAFFENEESQITHTGIILNPNEVIHSFGKVRIDSLDYSGIFNEELNKHTHKLRFVKNILDC